MSRIFTRKTFSTYLGENRALNDIITKYTETPDLSKWRSWLPPTESNTGTTSGYPMWIAEENTSSLLKRLVLTNGAYFVPDYGGGAYFDGTNDSGQYIQIPPTNYSFYPTSGPWTLSFWFEPYDTYPGYQRLVSTGQQDFEIACIGMNIAYYTPTNSWNTFSQSALTVNTPYFLTFTYDGTNLKYYRNGVLQDSDVATMDLSSTGVVSIASRLSFADAYESVWYRINVYTEVKDADFILDKFNENKYQYGY